MWYWPCLAISFETILFSFCPVLPWSGVVCHEAKVRSHQGASPDMADQSIPIWTGLAEFQTMRLVWICAPEGKQVQGTVGMLELRPLGQYFVPSSLRSDSADNHQVKQPGRFVPHHCTCHFFRVLAQTLPPSHTAPCARHTTVILVGGGGFVTADDSVLGWAANTTMKSLLGHWIYRWANGGLLHFWPKKGSSNLFYENNRVNC